jgi:NUMOD1 domain
LEYIDLAGRDNLKERREIVLKREQYYLDNINPSLNICKIAGSPLGVKHNISFSIKKSKARRGKVHKVNNINSNISKYTSPETRLKLSSRSKGICVKIYDKSYNLINKFPSMLSAANYVGVSDRTLRRVLNTGISYDNFIYEFEIETNNPIIVLNKEDNTTRNFYSIRTAAKDMGISCTNLS